MISEYTEKYFINPGIDAGIKSYLLYKDEKSYPMIHTFEMNVIKVLTIVYGEKSILLPYKIDNERAFECNLLMYDLKESDMERFINYLDEYYKFMQNFKSEQKATGLTSEIEQILMEMIVKRAKRKEFKPEEIAEFDKIFNPIEGDLKKIKSYISKNDGLIIRTWENNKYELTNTQIKMITVNPNLLTRDEYHKYGYDIRTIASLSEKEINEVNSIILKEEERVFEAKEKLNFFQRNRIVLTTGNGYIDKLLLLSIIATELMIGVVVTASIFGG